MLAAALVLALGCLGMATTDDGLGLVVSAWPNFPYGDFTVRDDGCTYAVPRCQAWIAAAGGGCRREDSMAWVANVPRYFIGHCLFDGEGGLVTWTPPPGSAYPADVVARPQDGWPLQVHFPDPGEVVIVRCTP